MVKKRFLWFFLFGVLVFLTSCANMVAPTGGPKDTTPPKVVMASPENRSVAFNGNRIEITFDEYVTLNNASQQVLVSPPLTTKPDIKLNNKTVVVKFKENLRPNTTYTIDFGEAIKDLHEGNLFKDYAYAFATGDLLDTLSIAGAVLDAETRKPVDKLYVGLYDGNLDSVFSMPLKQAPDYITRTDKEGRFRLNGLPDVPFLVFALEDMNANLFYDMPNEKVAFLDTLVCPSDSLDLTLLAFTETDTTQMLLENKLVEEGLFRFVFRQPADSVDINLTWPDNDTFQMVQVWSPRHDTLCCWFTPNVLDSLTVAIHDDTLINMDKTFSLQSRESRNQGRPNATKALQVANNLKNKLLMPNDDLTLSFAEPLKEIVMHDTSMLIAGNDTLFNIMPFERIDSIGLKYRLDMPINDTLDYTLVMADSVFRSVRGRTNTGFTLRFKRAKDTDFGNIFITVTPPEGMSAIVQLLDNKGKVVESQVIDSTNKVGFKRLAPDKYKLKAIIDADRNGQWSTGNFHQRFLPETVIDYKDELDLKAGWDIDLDEPWKL